MATEFPRHVSINSRLTTPGKVADDVSGFRLFLICRSEAGQSERSARCSVYKTKRRRIRVRVLRAMALSRSLHHISYHDSGLRGVAGANEVSHFNPPAVCDLGGAKE